MSGKLLDCDETGVYIIARDSGCNGRLRVDGEAPNYSLEIDFDVEPGLVEQTKSALFATVFDRLLPAVGAMNLRDTTQRPRPPGVR